MLPQRHLVPTRLSEALATTDYQLDPYVDYGRFLTAEGGVLLIFKDIDERLRHTLWRIATWTCFTSAEAFYLLGGGPAQASWQDWILLLVAAIINWLIVAKPVEIYRRLEVKPDCMIVDDDALFWTRFMEGGAPTCRADADGNQLLSGIYGTRLVEYLTVRRFDENDRMPEVFSAHFADAVQQQWARVFT